MSWYRQYRPTTVSGLHLTKVRQSLENLLKSGKFPHALLFAGPKGTGKTSAARILGAVLNDPQNEAAIEQIFFAKSDGKKTSSAIPSLHEPNTKEEIVQRIQRGQSFVVNELDAASNRGIDDIRQLKERIFLPPQEGKVAVYILDEVHMLTTEAFNALLKVLEEPPPHVVFILATTELHKIPETIMSRCTLIQFYKATPDELTAALTNILKQEKIEFDEAAVQLVVQLADGSFRDGVKLLENVAAGQKKLTTSLVQEKLNVVSEKKILELVTAITQKNEQLVVQLFQELRQHGQSPEYFHKALLEFLHTDLLKSVGVETGEPAFNQKITHFLLTQFLSIQSTSIVPFLGLELKALEIIFKAKEKNTPSGTGGGSSESSSSTGNSTEPRKKSPLNSALPFAQTVQSSLSDSSSNTEIFNVTPVLIKEVTQVEVIPAVGTFTSVSVTESLSEADYADGNIVIEKWEQFLAKVRRRNSSIEAVLRSSRPVSGEHGKAKIEVFYQFHQEQLKQPKFLKILEECSAEIAGGKVLFEFNLAKQSQAGAKLSNVSGNVNEEEELIKLAKDVLM
jgi:DNA polymerase-3 subunit gamma/tau